ncbi:unnamed protein product [Xylocopa violacea]|uniref:Uncharacterized protein n=1 Tax=Xylocopa violacea TaxID=135666 RepID=A0ABP1NL31_XYLVO
MAFPTNDLLKEVSKLDSVQQMKASVQSAIKCGMLVGASTILGGILGGRVGLTIGGVVSSCLAGYAAHENLQSVPYIICYETTPEQRKKLADMIINLLTSRHITTLRDFILSVRNNKELEDAIIQILIMFLSTELNMCYTR